jgi:hypothetical protein
MGEPFNVNGLSVRPGPAGWQGWDIFDLPLFVSAQALMGIKSRHRGSETMQ